MLKPTLVLVAALFAWASQPPPQPVDPAAMLGRIKLPEGFSIEVYAANVPNARQMALGAKGTLFVGSRTAGTVYAVLDKDGDYRADEVLRIATGLTSPSGVAFRDGALYVSEISRILRFDDIEARVTNPPAPVVVTDTLPADRSHGWKFIAFGPDGLLYVPVGAPCNVCERSEDSRYASILRMRPDGSGVEVFASGVRNTVGFDWHPVTKELWFTDNGRDGMGDDVPPDELNRAPRPGLHFGFPYCHGASTPDPEFGSKRPCSEFEPPAQALGPHVAAIGMRFYTGSMFPAEYRNQIVIAEHGSWNRSVPLGYRVTMATIDGSRVSSYSTFAEGWLRGAQPGTRAGVTLGDAWGRPADVLVLPDGSLLISEDSPGAIYRVTYRR